MRPYSPRALSVSHHFSFPYAHSPFLQGMRDVRASPLPVLEDARWRAINRAHAEAQKKRKDAKAAKRTKQILTREKLDERRRQQRKDGLPLEESPSPSLSMDTSDGGDEGERGWGPLDYLPDIEETAPGRRQVARRCQEEGEEIAF